MLCTGDLFAMHSDTTVAHIPPVCYCSMRDCPVLDSLPPTGLWWLHGPRRGLGHHWHHHCAADAAGQGVSRPAAQCRWLAGWCAHPRAFLPSLLQVCVCVHVTSNDCVCVAFELHLFCAAESSARIVFYMPHAPPCSAAGTARFCFPTIQAFWRLHDGCRPQAPARKAALPRCGVCTCCR